MTWRNVNHTPYTCRVAARSSSGYADVAAAVAAAVGCESSVD